MIAISPHGDADDHEGLSEQARQVEFGADRDEEEAEQKPLKRLDGHLDLAAILSFGEQQPCDEGADRHRQAAGRRDHARPDDHEQARGGEDFGRSGHSDKMEKGPKDEAADHHDGGQRERGRREGQHDPQPDAARVRAGQDRDREQQRRDREILEQQDRKGGSPGRRIEPLSFGQHGNDDGGRRQGQRAAHDE